MFTSRMRTAWVGAGLLLTLTAGSPVWADDVELLLSTPASSNAAKPNILFIIDSSGSMRTEEEITQEPFDAGKTYAGSCESDKYYWTTGSEPPSCSSSYKFYKTAFVCEQGVIQVAASGSYTDTMAQYRPNSKGKWKWRQPSAGQLNRWVECEEDSGDHGFWTNPTGEPYARAGVNVTPWTSDSNSEVNWGVKPTHKIVTVYDPNYLNWLNNAGSTLMRRTDIVKAVTKNVLGSINNVNVGFMRFHYEQGGPVIYGIKDLDSNRTEIDTLIDNIPSNGWTPLSETMYEAALYYRGMEGDYGQFNDTDTDAMSSYGASTDPYYYKQPAEYACSKNYVVLLTDGDPTRDVDVYGKTPLLPSYAASVGRSYCTGGNVNGACLDDISEYLSKVDINPTLPGNQHVTTHTIGFTVDLPLLKSTAENSGGEYYLASDVATLTKALTDIVSNIFDRDISFTAPAVAVNAFNRTQHLNDMYVSVFRATDHVHWPGNMKKYTIKDKTIKDAKDADAVDPNTGFFAKTSRNFWMTDPGDDGTDVYVGGSANKLPNPIARKVYTNVVGGDLTIPGNQVSVSNISSFTLADFGLTGVAGEPGLDDIIDWSRGYDVKDADNDPLTLYREDMGDTLHSQPAAVVYGDLGGGVKDVVLFNATNDGYLHAVNAETGQEMWSFIPHELLTNLADLYYDDNVDYKNYGIDGDIVPIIRDVNNDGSIDVGTDFVYLVFGMRRGGDNYYMLDVTDKNRPELKWIKTFPEIGQSWSTPVVARVDINAPGLTNGLDAVLILGGGYDSVHDAAAHPSTPDLDGASIYMLNLVTGDEIWRAGRDSGADLQLPMMTRAIPSKIRVIDLNGDQFADRMYAADLGGQVWRFDISNGKAPYQLVAGGVIAQLGAEGMSGTPTAWDTRRFYTTPDVAMFADDRHDRRYLAINIGSGYRAHPLDNSAGDRFYSLRDPDIFNQLTQLQYSSYPIIRNSDLVDVAGQFDTVIPADGDGWMLTLPPTEKVLSDSQTFDDSIFFVSFEPTVNSTDPCIAGQSINRLYRLDIVNGDPVIEYGQPVPADGAEADVKRVEKLEQGGIAPRPQFFFPSPTDPNCKGTDCTPTPIGCVGVECFDPGFPNYPVRTLWTQDGID